MKKNQFLLILVCCSSFSIYSSEENTDPSNNFFHQTFRIFAKAFIQSKIDTKKQEALQQEFQRKLNERKKAEAALRYPNSCMECFTDYGAGAYLAGCSTCVAAPRLVPYCGLSFPLAAGTICCGVALVQYYTKCPSKGVSLQTE